MRHGYKGGVRWVGTRRLPWGDALAIITQQKQQDSAVFRAQFPEDYDRTRESQILELLAVFLRQTSLLMGNQSGIARRDLPAEFEDLFQKTPTLKSDEDVIAAIAAYEKG